MGHAREEIQSLLGASGGVVSGRQHPELTESLRWLARCGELVAVLPGIYCPPVLRADQLTRIRAAMLWDPDAVLVGSSAAAVSFWPELRSARVTLASSRQHRARPEGFALARRTIPTELIVSARGLRYTAPALTALDLCDTCGGDGIDTVLRTRAATLDGIRAAMQLSKGRSGNQQRRQLLFDSRDEPWSAAERLSHHVLRDAGIFGWRSNFPVAAPGGTYYLDVAFRRERVALEIDGRLHEADRAVFESDRWRQNHLVRQGWQVFRFTWLMLTESPELVVETVRGAVAPETSRQLP